MKIRLRMLWRAARILPAWSGVLLFGQTQTVPSFEAADVKVNKSGEVRMAVDFQAGGRFSARNVPLKVLVGLAYHVRPDMLRGGPGWMDSERYDVVAKASQTVASDDLRRMLQTLLAERFKLAVHTEQRPAQAYGLVVAKSGHRMQPSAEAIATDRRCSPGTGPPEQRHVVCRHLTMALLADTLQELAPRDVDVPVVDQTGLEGAFDFSLDWTPAAAGSTAAPAGLTLFEAVENQLGLRLESRKLPLPVVVIDSVERVPTEN